MRNLHLIGHSDSLLTGNKQSLSVFQLSANV